MKNTTNGNCNSNTTKDSKDARKPRSRRSSKSAVSRDHSRNTDRRTSRYDEGANDPSWYTNNMALVNNAGSFSFNNAMGNVVYDVNPDGYNRAIPGVLEYVVQMVPGISLDPFSPINIAARALYDRVNYKNSRNFSYDAPDLMMYVYGVSSAYAYWAWMVRAYGIMNTYSQINKYVPDSLVKATGIEPESIRVNMAQFRYYINLFARKINVLAVPQGMPIFARYLWLFSNVYMDAENRKAGLYISKPYGFYKYVENTSTGGACLMKPLTKEFMTYEDIVNYGNEIAEALLSSQDINNMSTDILKAFEGSVLSIPDTAEAYFVTPVYSKEVLEQIHNLRCYGDYVIGGTSESGGVVTVSPSGNLIQDPTTGYLSFEMELPDASFYTKFVDEQILIDSFKDDPSPEDVFVMTRMIASLNNKTGKLMDAGSDIVLKMRVWNREEKTKDIIPYGYNSSYQKIASDTTVYKAMVAMGEYSFFDKFDAHPFMWSVYDDGTKLTSARMFGDTYNYTNIDKVALHKLHEAALLSMFSVPGTLGTK